VKKLIVISFLIIGCLSVWAQPANDEPCDAHALPIYNSCFNEFHGNIDATISSSPSRPACQPSGSSGDVWFSFTMPSNGQVTVDLLGQNIDLAMDEIRYVEAAYYTGTCGSLSFGGCSSSNLFGGSNSITINESVGTVIYIRVYDDDVGSSASQEGLFSICATSSSAGAPPSAPSTPECVSNPPPSDICSSAPLINNLDGYCGSTGDYTDGGGTEPSSANDLFCGSLENNSWLQFEASGTEAIFYIHLSGCSSDFQARIFESNDCINFIPKSNCLETTSSPVYLYASDLTIGNTYYIMMDGYGSGSCDFTIGAESGVVVPGVLDTIEVCDNEVLTVSVSSANTTLPFVLEYVLQCGGTTYGPNSSGLFDLEALGINGSSVCSVYAVNHDGTETFATWPVPVSNCLEYIEKVVDITAAPDLQVVASLTNTCPSVEVDLADAVVSADGGVLTYFSDDSMLFPISDPSAVGAGIYFIVSTVGDCLDMEEVEVTISNCPGDPIYVCANQSLSVSVSNANLTSPYVLEYVLECGGTVYGPNSTGYFNVDSLGIGASSNCVVYAVNHDGTETFANWPVPVSDCLEDLERPVVIEPLVTGSESLSLCPGDSISINGSDYYSSAGNYTDTISGSNCDSVVTLTLTTNPLSGLYAASSTDYHRVDPLTGDIISTINNSPLTTGWVNGCFTIHEQGEKIYWLSDAFNLESLDLNSGASASVGTAIGTLPFFWSLKYYNGHLYTITTAADNDKKLVRINPATGALDAGFSGIEVNGTAADGLYFGSSPVIDPVNDMYYLPLLFNKLLAIDLVNNTGKVITLSGFLPTPGYVELLEVNEYTGQLYGFTNYSNVVSINMTGPTSADVDLVKTLTLASGYSNPASTFDSDRGLYIFQAESGCGNSPLVAVDVSTGQQYCNDPVGDAFFQLEYLNCSAPSTLRTESGVGASLENDQSTSERSVGYDSEISNEIKLYPNPVTSFLTVESANLKGLNYSISTITGETQLRGTFVSGTESIDMSSLAMGIYLMTIDHRTYKLLKAQ